MNTTPRDALLPRPEHERMLQTLNRMPSLMPWKFTAKSSDWIVNQDAVRIKFDDGGFVDVPSEMLGRLVKDRIVTKHIRRPSFWRMLCVIGLHWTKWKPGRLGEPLNGRCVRCRQWQVK